jgi:hypothetical protein
LSQSVLQTNSGLSSPTKNWVILARAVFPNFFVCYCLNNGSRHKRCWVKSMYMTEWHSNWRTFENKVFLEHKSELIQVKTFVRNLVTWPWPRLDVYLRYLLFHLKRKSCDHWTVLSVSSGFCVGQDWRNVMVCGSVDFCPVLSALNCKGTENNRLFWLTQWKNCEKVQLIGM